MLTYVNVLTYTEMSCRPRALKLCGRSKEECETCYNRSLASKPHSKLLSEDNNIDPKTTVWSTKTVLKFYCKECDHKFDLSGADMCNRLDPCLFCAESYYRLCDNELCKHCWKRSFASHELAVFMTESNTVTARQLTLTSHTKIELQCKDCRHPYPTFPYKVAVDNRKCQYCTHQKLCENNDCEMCFNNSFASSRFASMWSSKNKTTPRQEFIRSTHICKFDCPDCLHEFSDRLDKLHSATIGCQICANKKLCDNEKCKLCFANSFASNKMAEHWSQENKLSPRQVFKSSSSKQKFICPECQASYSAFVNNIAKRGNSCRCCSNKGEGKLERFLKERVTHEFEPQAKFDWCKGKRCYPFDFVFPTLKVILELDGGQHFGNSRLSNWTSAKETQKRDKYKMRCALKNGYTVVRVMWTDVYHGNTNNWQERLLKVLRIYDEPSLILLDNIGEYNIFHAKWAWKPVIVNKRLISSKKQEDSSSAESSVSIFTKQRAGKRAGSPSSSSSSPRTSRVAGRGRAVMHIDVPTPGKRRAATKRAR